MIKFWFIKKYIKYLYIIIFLSCFILLWSSFVNAFSVEKIWVNISSPVINNNVDFSVLPYGSFISSYLWQGRPVIAFANRSLNANNTRWQYIYYMWIDWKLYYYYSYAVNSSSSMTNYQWFFNIYSLCDELTENSTTISNCSDSPYNEQTINDFLYTVSSSDYYWINWGTNRSTLCISSSTYWKSICFRNTSSSNLSWSLNFPALMVFEDLYWYDSQSPAVPINPWINGGWWNAINVTFSWNLLYNTCTNWYVINKIQNIYWSDVDRVCYAWTFWTWEVTENDNYFLPKPNYWLTYKETYKWFTQWSSWIDWFRMNEQNMLNYKSWRIRDNNWNIINPFIWYPLSVYSYFTLLYDNWRLGWWSSNDWPEWFWPYFISNYCSLRLDSDYDLDYKWSFFKNYCSDLNFNDWWTNYNSWEIWNIDDDEILPPWFNIWNNNNVWSSWATIWVSWDWTLSWDINKNFDWKNFINSAYQKLQERFIKPNNWIVWFIPTYIIVFMLALILFRFLQH